MSQVTMYEVRSVDGRYLETFDQLSEAICKSQEVTGDIDAVTYQETDREPFFRQERTEP